MIDPFTAFAAAQAAVKGIQAAVKMGKDIQSITGDLMKFFDAKDAVVTASSKGKKKGQSATGEAMELVMQSHALQKAEKDLKELLVYSGNAQLWDQMLVERNRINKERRAAERHEADKRRKRRQSIIDIFQYLLVAMGIVIILLFSVFATLEFTKV